MTPPTVTLRVLPTRLAVCRLPAGAGCTVPAATCFFALTRTGNELSIVCEEQQTPPGATVESGWLALEVQGPLDFALTGILAAIVGPLARAEVPVFAISTYDTDYVLVRADRHEQTVSVLRVAGHTVDVD